MKKTSILITGGTGFIGANLTHALLSNSSDIHLITQKSSDIWRLKKIRTKIKFHQVNLTNSKHCGEIIQKINPDLVFHCAAYGVKHNHTNFEKMIKTNIHGTLNLFSALSTQNVKKIVNLGSVFEYGIKTANKGFLETDPLTPLTFYGITKVTQTNIAQYFFKSHSLPVVTLRLFTPYGILEEKGRLISDIMLALIKGHEFKLTSPNSVRDFVFVTDVIDAIIKASTGHNVDGEIINIGSGKPITVGGIVKICKKFSKVNENITLDDSKMRDYDLLGGKGFANIAKAKKKLNWVPTVSIEEGLKKSYNWYRKNLSYYH